MFLRFMYVMGLSTYSTSLLSVKITVIQRVLRACFLTKETVTTNKKPRI